MKKVTEISPRVLREVPIHNQTTKFIALSAEGDRVWINPRYIISYRGTSACNSLSEVVIESYDEPLYVQEATYEITAKINGVEEER